MFKEICDSTREYAQTKHGVIKINGAGLSRKQRNMLNLASKVAESSEFEKKKHGAVIVKAGRILSVGVNKWRNQDLVSSLHYDPNLTVHAEMDALSRVENPSGAILYVSRINQNGKEQYSRPCTRCAKVLSLAKIKTVVYTS